MDQLTGPIPGENYTSDTKNYPWHRPPEYTDLDKAIEYAGKRLMDEESAVGTLTMMEMGMDIATITDTFLTAGIGAGKWTVDFALLMAGPVSHILYLMAKGANIEPDLGIGEDPNRPKTSAYFKEIQNDQKRSAGITEAVVSEIAQLAEERQQGMSFGSMPRPENMGV